MIRPLPKGKTAEERMAALNMRADRDGIAEELAVLVDNAVDTDDILSGIDRIIKQLKAV